MKKADKKASRRQPLKPDPQLDGGPDLDTTEMDRPTDLRRRGGDLIGSEHGEHGPLTVVPAEHDVPGPMDPSGDDPFVPGTAEAAEEFNPDDLLDEREKKVRERERHAGSDGPTYEAQQGNLKEDHGGSIDPNSDLTEDTSGYQRRSKRAGEG